MGSFMIYTPHQILFGSPNQNDEMGGVLERGAYRVSVGDLRERDHFEDLDVEERIIVK